MLVKTVASLLTYLTFVSAVTKGNGGQDTVVEISNPNSYVDLSSAVKCVPITSKICRGHLIYNNTLLPNNIGMSEAQEIELRLGDYSGLMETKCSRFIAFFICSMYIPMCSNGMFLQPCRRFCVHIKQRCGTLVKAFTTVWPHDLECEKLPDPPSPNPNEEQGTALCIKPPSYDNDDQFVLSKDNALSENLMNILKSKDGHILERYIGRERLLIGDITTPVSSRCAADEVDIASFSTNASCLQRCHAAFYFRAADRRFAEVWMAIWASVCVLSTMLTFFTFVIDVRQGGQRFQYPERPIVYLSVCYFFYSSVFLLRSAIGGDAISCRNHFQTNGNGDAGMFLVRASHGGTWCTIVFLVLYFFMMAASLWWVILCFTWFLSAARRWGHEGVERVSSVFHVVAWALPAIKSMAILIMQKIDGDELTGLCFVGSQERQSLLLFVVLPLLFYLCTGSFFLLWGFCSLFTVRKDLKTENGTANVRRLEKLMAKIGVFSILYIVPAVCVVAAYLYEYVERPRWQSARQAACHASGHVNPNRKEGCLATIRPTVEVYILKNFMGIAVGITSGVWVWGNKKSLDSWSLYLRRICGSGSGNGAKKLVSHAHPPTASYRCQLTQARSPQPTEADQYTYAGSSLLSPIKPQSPSAMMKKFGPNSSCV